MAEKMKSLDVASWILCTIAAVHLGLVGAFAFNVFDAVFGVGSIITQGLYVIIGLGGLWSVRHMVRKK